MNKPAGQPQEKFPALPTLRKRASKSPTYENLINLAIGLRTAAHFHEAQEVLAKCIAMDPTEPAAWNNLGQVMTDLGQFRDAPRMFQRSMECHEKHGVHPTMVKQTLLGFAYSMMRLGKFEFIWPCWEAARYGDSWQAFPQLFPWAGEPDARLLILPEGGLGDGFNFLRWLPSLSTKAGGFSVLIWDPLFTSCQRLSMSFLPLSHEFRYAELEKFSHCTPILSLPGFCGMKSWSDIPAPLDWRANEVTILDGCGRIVSATNDLIGFCWRAEENGVQRRSRSLDSFTADRIGKDLARRCSEVVSLCPKASHLYREQEVRIPKGVTHSDERLTTWEATAITILRCKFVVTVDTAVCHLAGSLGVPTLLLLPVRSDWKWGVPEEPLPPWYGPQFKAFRNTDPAHWDVDGIISKIQEVI